MAGSLPPIQDYYKILWQFADPGGALFRVPIAIVRLDVFAGDGSEFGDGAATGKRQLRRLLDKAGEGFARNGWASPSILDVEANTTTKLAITLPTPD